METSVLTTEAANQANIHEDIFHRQKAYFATSITKSLEWRLDQLDRERNRPSIPTSSMTR